MFDDNINENNDKTLQIAKERDAIKEKMTEKLKSMNFTQDEIKSVMQIIFIAEGKIEALKSTLIGTNINNPDPTPAMAQVISQIKQLQINMAEDIQKRVSEIQAKKKNKELIPIAFQTFFSHTARCWERVFQFFSETQYLLPFLL